MKLILRFSLLLTLCVSLFPTIGMAKTKVATLHPVLSDIARSVGGEKVTVVSLVGSGKSVHEFQPTGATIRAAEGAVLYLAAGKGLEPYLPRMKSMVGDAKVIEVGKKITSITVSNKNPLFVCCPGHTHGVLDPHWWNSIKSLKRATSVVAVELGKVDPANKALYKSNAKTYRKKLDKLNSWTKKQLSVIPKNRRYLATAHAAYAYFCRDYGFKSVPVQGLNQEQKLDPKYLALAISKVKEHKIKAIFPEIGNNPKALKVIAKETGAKIGDPLIPDGIEDVEKLFKSNVKAIVKGLKQ